MSKLLTVGMATYGDPCGCWFTITGLRANHPRVDLIVVDNAPLPDTRTRDVCVANGGRYFHKPNLAGTAAPRDEVFRLSQTLWTACVDSHVIFETGAIQGLIDYAEEHPESKDIVQGPLVYDNGTATTHWRATDPPALWGVWMDAWMHPSGVPFDVLPTSSAGENRTAAFAPVMPNGSMPLGLPDSIPWDRRHEVLGGLGCVPAAEQRSAFEIPAMGLGVWAMRTAAWPGFSPLFAGFGGEEGYLHEVVRRRGGKALCLPAMRWRHWFRDGTTPAPYPHFHEHQTWNNLVAHRELGIDAVEQIRRHPDTGARMQREHFDAMVRGTAACQPWNTPGERPAPLKILGVWYSNNAAPHKVLKASLDSIKRAADLSRADVRVMTCPWEPIAGNPFPQVLAESKGGPGHLNIVRQQRQCVKTFGGSTHGFTWRGDHETNTPDVVCFLEHDCLYPPDYFDRVARAFRENPAAPVVSNLDYEGLNATGWLAVKERHEPMHQLSMRYDIAVANLERCEAEAAATGQCLLEPQGDRADWVRIQPRGLMPAIHVNHPNRLTSHGEVVFHADSRGRTFHPFWGQAADYWPAEVRPTVTIPAGCNTCGGQPAPAAPPPFATIAEWYADAQTRPSDFHMHVRTMKDLADQCEAVAEISLWDDKPATVALAASSAKRVVSVRAVAKRIWGPLQKLRPDFIAATDDGPVRDGVDLLFLDEHHRAQDVFDGLVRYAPHVRRYLVIHCTTDPYGETGDDGGPGVMPGVRRFLDEHREWTAIRHDKHNHGLIVLSRDDRDKKQPPGLIRQAMNFAKALAVHAKDGNRLVNDRVFELRMAECLACPERAGDQCAACGCPVDAKASWASETCGLVKKGEEPKWKATVAAEDMQ